MSDKKRYVLLIFIAAASVVFEAYGSDRTSSWGLFSDALHMAADGSSFVLGFAVVCAREQNRETYGKERVIRLMNAAFLIGLGAFVAAGAVWRIWQPKPINGTEMALFALFSLASNGLQFCIGLGLHSAHNHHATFKSQLDHLLGDVYTSLAVLAGAIGIMVFDSTWFDTAAALFGSWKVCSMGMRTWQTVDNPHSHHGHEH